MNHINWVQQDPDYKTEYHVLKWGSSHFHEPQARRMTDSALHREGAASAVFADRVKDETAEVGLGLASNVKSGGFALSHGQDAVAISAQGAERQSGEAASQTVVTGQAGIPGDPVQGSVVVQHAAHPRFYDAAKPASGAEGKEPEQEEMKQDTVAAAAGQGSIRNRLKESASRLQEAYQKQKEKIKRTVFQSKRVDKKADIPKKGTREADREETLSMQAQNHYLLDSYDRNGQYSMLGK